MSRKKRFPSDFLFEPTCLHKKIIESKMTTYGQEEDYVKKVCIHHQTNNHSNANPMHNNNSLSNSKKIVCSNENYQIFSKILYIRKEEKEFGFSVRGGQDVGFLAKIAYINSGNFYF